jgi:hypothetical protein
MAMSIGEKSAYHALRRQWSDKRLITKIDYFCFCAVGLGLLLLLSRLVASILVARHIEVVLVL